MTSLPLPFYDNPLLFGRAGTPGLLAFDAADRTVHVYARRNGRLSVSEQPLRPFLLLADRDLLRGFRGGADIVPLEGEGAYQFLAECPSWAHALRLRDHCQGLSGIAAGAPHAPYRFFSDPTHQHLLRSGQTSFLGMGFEDLVRMALDIEVTTASGFDFPNATRESDRIIAVALADSTGFVTVLSGAEMSEPELLVETSRLIRERDPDVLEGHNIFRFDLEYLESRARRHRVRLDWGRDGSSLRGRPARMHVADRSIAYRRYTVAGRHIVDTWILAQLHDVAARDLESYSLKDVAKHFGVAAAPRTYLDPEDIPRMFLDDAARVLAYARDDVTETLALSGVLSPPYFVQAQALPFDYQATVLRGNATKIDALLMREYLHRRQAIPAPATGRSVAGGYTAMFQQGVARDVLHVDVASLYPSLMLSQEIFPASDRLRVSALLLADLRTFRLAAKALARAARSDAERGLLGGLQQTFKILINSFYGYLAFSQGHWNDFEAANQVTAEGRRLVTALVSRLGAIGATVIEVDTDGLYFVPSPASPEHAAESADRRAREEALLIELSAGLPPGISLELDGRYPAMFSYKMKNYVLLDAEGKLLVRGSGLRSRGIEIFQRLWMEEMFRLLLTGRRSEVARLVGRWQDDFRARRVPLRQFMKTETLRESLEAYRQKVSTGERNASAAYELALASPRLYQSGDQISYYVAGDEPRVAVSGAAKLASDWDSAHPDENTGYYVHKVRELYDKFRALIERDGLIAVVETTESREPTQQDLYTLDLFPNEPWAVPVRDA